MSIMKVMADLKAQKHQLSSLKILKLRTPQPECGLRLRVSRKVL